MAVYGDELYHYGVPRKSGRYPYGSGKEPYQDNPKKRRLNKDESAPKATSNARVSTQKNSSKKPESIWAKHRRAQAEKKVIKDREAKKTAAEKPQSKAKTMSDEELKRAIARMNLEQEYLSKISASSATKNGKTFMKNFAEKTDNISKIVGNTSKTLAGAYAIYISGKKILDLLEKEK